MDETNKTIESSELNHLKEEGNNAGRKILNSRYGRVLVDTSSTDTNRVDPSAVLTTYDALIQYNYRGLLVATKNKSLADLSLPSGELVGDHKFIYQARPGEGMQIELTDVFRAMGISLEQRPGQSILLRSYVLKNLHPPYRLVRPHATTYYTYIDMLRDLPDPAIKHLREAVGLQEIIASGKRVIEAPLEAADGFIRGGRLEELKNYYRHWKEIKSPKDTTFQTVVESLVPAPDDWGYEMERHVFPELFEYLVFEDERDFENVKSEAIEKSFRHWLRKQKWDFARKSNKWGADESYVWIGGLRISGLNGKLRISAKQEYDHERKIFISQPCDNPITMEDFEDLSRNYVYNKA